MEFIYLKRTYPVSQFERICDAFNFFTGNSTADQREEWGIDIATLRSTIKEGEKYIYQVGKDGNQFKTVCSSIENFALVRKHIYGIKDDI